MTAHDAAEAVANARNYNRYDQGLCLQWVRGPCWEIGSLYGSAIEAWNASPDKHPGDRNPPFGAACFYEIGKWGHVVIRTDRIRSTDCTSSTYVNEADLDWPEKAWNARYLGWSGSLNGVDLPLDTGPGKETEPMPEYTRATAEGVRIKGGVWTPITWENVPTDSAGDTAQAGNPGVLLGGRRFVATLNVTAHTDGLGLVQTRIVEGAFTGSGGEWEALTLGEAHETATSGTETHHRDTIVDRCTKDPEGRRVRFQIRMPEGEYDAELSLLHW